PFAAGWHGPRTPVPAPTEHSMDALPRYLDDPREQFLENLKAALRIPSVRPQAERAGDVKRCAEHIAAHLKSIGMQNVEVVPTAGHPVVYAEWLTQRRVRSPASSL